MRQFAASPTADVLAYLLPSGTNLVPTLFDLRTKTSRPLQPGAALTTWTGLRWSPDGTRLLLVGKDHDLQEVEVATGRVVRTLPLVGSQTLGATYAGDEVVIGRISWRGDVWTAELSDDSRAN